MLREYQDVSNGKIRLEILEPRPDTDVEEAAESSGLQGIAPEGAPERIFMGLVLKDENDNKQTIAFFDPRREDSLEYDISKALYNVTHPERKTIGVLSSINVMGDSPNPMAMMQQQPQTSKPWAFIREMKNNFQVKKVEANATEIPKDLDMLLIIHPKTLSDATQYAIEQYVLAGGKAAVFVDPFCEADKRSIPADNMQMQMQASFSSDMPKLLKEWGVELKTIENSNAMMGMMGGGDSAGPAPGIVEDPTLAVKVNNPRAGTPQDMIVWLNITDKQRNDKEVVTSQLENILMAAPGALKKTASSSDITITPLMTTSDKAALTGDMMLKFGPNPEQLLRDYKSGGAKLNLAVKITGKFKRLSPRASLLLLPHQRKRIRKRKSPRGRPRIPTRSRKANSPRRLSSWPMPMC